MIAIQRYNKTFVFEIEENKKYIPVYYPMTERVELLVNGYYIKPDYVVDDHGIIEIKEDVMQLESGL